MAQDDYYYEIQLTNKQLVFYFMAGATGLILSFLAGVMVGKGVDAAAGEVQAARPVVEERIVAEEPLARATTPPPAEELTYAKSLEGDKPEEATLGARARSTPAPARVADAGPAAKLPSAPKAAPTPVAAKPTPKPSAKPPAPPSGPSSSGPSSAGPASSGPASFTIQVGAFKDKATADSVVTRLKAKGFAAYLMAPEAAGAGLFNVRVGSYPARAEAERIQAKLRDQEKFKPFIVKN